MVFARRERRGFTLIEMFVVIAVIAALLALLFPAMQRVREAASRTQCLNNLKQIGFGFAGYHDKNDAFPPGGTRCTTQWAWHAYGRSFWVDLLPFLEQGNLWQQIDKTGTASGTTYASTGWIGTPDAKPANHFNAKLLNKIKIPMLHCPSSPLPLWSQWSTSPNMLEAHYTGISGSVDYPFTTGFGGKYNPGIVSKSGVLIPDVAVAKKDITDGISNTMMIGEQSDYCSYANGTKAFCRSSCNHGFSMGRPNYFPPDGRGDPDQRIFNLTTIRYMISKDATLANSGGNCGANSPLQSAHHGGAMILMADGSVHFLLQTTSVGILKRLAVRNDGMDVGDWR